MKTYIIDIETLGLQPWHGRIVCIVIKDIKTAESKIFAGKDEKVLLEGFWNEIGDSGAIFYGYNSDEFDLPFILKRSLIQNVKMKKILGSGDLRKIVNGFWFSYRKDIKGTLRDWARVLHMPVKTESGGEVFKLYKAGDFESIINHCLEDVEVTYKLYLRCKDSNLLKF